MENLYTILGVSEAATVDEIKKSYKVLVKKYHPDTNPNDKTLDEKFKKITDAYKILSNEALRKEYDEKTAEKNKKANNSKTKQNKGGKSGNTTVDSRDFQNQFESFFGFNPKTKEKNSNLKDKKGKNPIDTTNMFNSFFNKR